jgi:polar amino acid transport system substrate-binding protein
MRAPAAATRILTVLVVMSLWGVQAGEAVNASAPPERPSGDLVVGTFEVPPFAMRDSGGSWSGIAIELWREVARRQGIPYRLEEHDLQSLLAAVETGRVDVAVGPLLITADRERLIDLTSPFMHVALAIGTRPETGWWAALRSVLSGPLLWATLGLAVLLLVFAALVWLLERHRNPEHFGGARMRGLGDAIWWSASTMSTVGYGDRTPVTFWGRTTGIVWMFVSIVLVSAFIALVTSAVTVRQLQTQIRSIADLARVRVAAVSASGSAEYLRDLGIIAVSCETVGACLDALVAGDVDAVVEEWPVLRWEARHRYPGRLAIVPQPFARGFLGFALPRDSPRRRALNVTLLQVLDDPAWQEISRTYLGGASGEGSGLVSARAP